MPKPAIKRKSHRRQMESRLFPLELRESHEPTPSPSEELIIAHIFLFHVFILSLYLNRLCIL